MTNLRDRFQNGGSKNLDVKKENTRILIPKSEADYTSEAESLRFVKAYYKQKSRYIPEIDYKDPSTFAFFGSAEKYYEDSINNIYSAYPYDGSKAEKMEWSLSASYLDLYLLEHEYPKEVGSINIARTTVTGGTGTPSSGANENPYFTVQTPKFIKFFGGPQKNTIYDSSKNRESNIKIDGTTGNTVEFWLKKDNSSWLGGHTREVILDINSSNTATNSAEFGRMTVELRSPPTSSPNSSPFFFTYRKGNAGTPVPNNTSRGLNLGDATITKGSVADGKWHHYAITAITSGTNTVYKFYVDGTLNHTVTHGSVVGPVNTFLSGTIGASTSNGASATMGRGQLSASLDEVRIWKTARTEKEIGRFWYSPVHGGTDNDHTNADLGIYYKFNEGILGTQSADKVVLDYSGRINNGEIVNWDSSLRSLDSAITLSEAVPEEDYVEHGDPIINAENTKITTLETELKKRGRSHDVSNLASLRNSVPQHFTDTDTGEFLDLLQIMSSTFDDLFIKIKQLPKMKDFSYQEFFAEKGSYKQSQNNQFLVGCEDISLKEFTGHHAKPWVSNILEHFGMVSSDIFQDATLFERFFNRTEEVSFEHDLEEVKRLVLSNIHKNLIHILKTKGTEDSFRNLIRCFGVDDEIIKLNAYGDNEEYELITKPIYTTVKQKALSFKGQNFQGNIYNALSGSDTDAASFITGSSTSSPLTMEGNFIFPKYDINSSVGMTNASLFGMHSIADDAQTNASLTFRSTDNASLQVRAVKRAFNEPSAYFELTSSEGIINSISSSYIPDVYENQHWNISVRVGAKEGIDFNIQTPSEYFIEFTGYNYDLDVLKNSFQVSASISAAAYNKISEQNKAVFVGSHRTNFSGSLLESTDVKVLGFNAWRDVLTEEELKEHAQNPKVFGRKKPQSISNFDSGANLLSLDSLIFRWQFEAHTSSSAGGELEILDMSSGSLSNGIGHKYNGKAQGLVNQSEAISQEFLPGVEYFGPDNAYSSDRVKIKSTELDKFQADSKPVTYNFAFEKSMYQVISREMVNFFAGIVGFSNIIGEPVNKYRRKYKLLEKIRNRFFLRVGNEPDIEKFIEYYKWIDSSLSKFLGQLIPASSFLDSEIKDVVESHVLERNKYEHKAPTVEFKDPSDRIYPILGVNELLYDWEHGHAQTVFDQLVNKKAIQLGANGDGVDLGDKSSLTFNNGSGTDLPFSISAWIKVEDVSAESGVIVSKRHASNGEGEYFLDHVNGKLRVILYDDPEGGAFSTTNRIFVQSAAGVLQDNTWHHVVATYDASKNASGVKIYLDGAALTPSSATKTNYNGMGNEAASTFIGGTQNPTSNTFEDFMADVVFFDKAVSPTEVTELYNSGKVKDMTTFTAYSNIISWYKMGDDLDTTGASGIRDYVSTNHGTIVGSAAIVAESSLGSDTETVTRGWDESRPQDQNCLWLKERSEVSTDREAIKKIAYTEVSGSTYATRRLVKPYRLTGDNIVTNKAGFNRDANKNTELYKVINTGTNITLKGSALGLDPECSDNINPNKKKMYKGKTDVTGTTGYLDGDSDLILPFNLVSSSAGTDLPGLKDNVRVANNHLDLDITGEKSLRGPFGETHIGGMPHNKVRFGTAISERPEAYSLNVNTGTKTLTVDSTPINAPKSMYFRGVSGTRFANVSNIRHDTSSLVLGNYNKDYEIVMTNGRATNNDHFVNNEGSWVGVFTLPQDGGLTDIVNYSVPDRGRTDHVIVNRFSAPGSPESQGSFAMDSESEEFSVYNTMNYRNLLVRDTLNKLHAERSNQFGLRKGSATQASLHMTNRNFTRLTGALGQEVEPDSFFVQRPIPAHDFSYSWITASADEDVYSFLNKNENYGHQHTMGRVSGSMKSSQTISFLGSSQLVPNLDFVHGNFYATASLNTTTNTVAYTDTALNSQILNVQGPYGWPTWKQIRGYEHPISRYERLNAKISLVTGKNAVTSRTQLFPKTIQRYKWSTNPSLQDIDLGGTAVVEKIVEVFDEIMATNRFNPLTITFHGAQARDLTTRSISQTLLEHYWNNDETSLVALGPSAGILSGLPALQTRLASLKISAANEESTFANYDLTERLGMQDVRLPETVSDILRELGDLSVEEEDIYATEINYIETLYPREVNTFTKESRIREKFDFHAWRDTRALRQIMLTGSIVNHVGSKTNVGILANQAGASFRFDGSNDFIEIADNDMLSPLTSSITNVAVRSFSSSTLTRISAGDQTALTFAALSSPRSVTSSFFQNVSNSKIVLTESVSNSNQYSFVTTAPSTNQRIAVMGVTDFFKIDSNPNTIAGAGSNKNLSFIKNKGTFSLLQSALFKNQASGGSNLGTSDHSFLKCDSSSSTNGGRKRVFALESQKVPDREYPYSICLWIKPELSEGSLGNPKGIVGKGRNSNTGREWYLAQTGRKLAFYTFSDGPTNAEKVRVAFQTSVDVLDIGSWQQIAITYEHPIKHAQQFEITNASNLVDNVVEVRKGIDTASRFNINFSVALGFGSTGQWEASSGLGGATNTLTIPIGKDATQPTVVASAGEIARRMYVSLTDATLKSQIGHRLAGVALGSLGAAATGKFTFYFENPGHKKGFDGDIGSTTISNTDLFRYPGGIAGNDADGYDLGSTAADSSDPTALGTDQGHPGRFAKIRVYKNGEEVLGSGGSEIMTMDVATAAGDKIYRYLLAKHHNDSRLVVGQTPWLGTSTEFRGEMSNLLLYKHETAAQFEYTGTSGAPTIKPSVGTRALSPQDIKRLYNGGKVFDYRTNSRYKDMVGYFTFDSLNSETTPTTNNQPITSVSNLAPIMENQTAYDLERANTSGTVPSPVVDATPGLTSAEKTMQSFMISMYLRKINTSSSTKRTILSKGQEWVIYHVGQHLRLRLYDSKLEDEGGSDYKYLDFNANNIIPSGATSDWNQISIQVFYDSGNSNKITVKFYKKGSHHSTSVASSTGGAASNATATNDGMPSLRMMWTDSPVIIGDAISGLDSSTDTNFEGFIGEISNALVFKNDTNTFERPAAAILELASLNGITSSTENAHMYDYRRHPLASELVSWWRLNLTAGNNQPDAIGSVPAVPASSPNDPGSAETSFLKEKDFQDRSFSLSGWFKLQGQAGAIISKSDRQTSSDQLVSKLEWSLVVNADGKLELSLYDDRPLNPSNTTSAAHVKKTFTSTNAAPAAAWSHVVVVYKASSNTVDFYINNPGANGANVDTVNPVLTGANVTGSPVYTSMSITDTKVHFGAEKAGSALVSRLVAGHMFNTVIYNAGKEISGAEAVELYNGGNAWEIKQASVYSDMLSYYKLNSGTLTDLKSNSTATATSVSLDHNPGLNIVQNEDRSFTMAFWFKKDTTSSTKEILGKWGNTSADQEYRLNQNNRGLKLTVKDTTGTDAQAITSVYTSNATILNNATNGWQHVVITYNAVTGLVNFYVDSTRDTGGDTASSGTGYKGTNSEDYFEMQDGNANFFLGSTSTTPGVSADISNLLVFKHAELAAPLTDSEVVELYNEGFVYDYGTHSRETDLVLWWKLDDASGTSVQDSSGQNFTGTANATMNPVAASSSGLQNRAFVTTPITIAAWIKPDTISGNGAIISKHAGSPNNEFSFTLEGKILKFYISDTNSTHHFTSGQVITNASQWYHVAVAYTPNTGQSDGGDVVFYVDGTAHADSVGNPSSGFSHPVSNTSAKLIIGAINNGSAQRFDGNIAKVLMWLHNPSVAPLTSTQIQTIANLGFCYSDASIPRLSEALGYWKLDDLDLIGTSTQVINYASGSLVGANSGASKDADSSPDTFSLFYKTEQANKFDYRSSNGHGVDFADVSSASSVGASPNFITASRWPLDARTSFNLTPLDLVTSSFNSTTSGDCFTYIATSQGSRGEGIFQNDYSIFGAGANFQHGTPPVAPVYSRRIPQIHDGHEYLAGEAEWKAAEQLGSNPFSTDFEKHAENYRQVGQDHSLVPEFIISDHVEDVILNSAGEFSELTNREAFLSVTGAVYHTSSQELQVSEKFYKTYGISDMMKYFGVTLDHVEANDLGDPLKLTLRCKAALKFTPYRGFYPVERVQQITELFTRGYMPEFDFETTGEENKPAFVVDQEVLLKTKIRANLQQSIKPLFAPGVLMNSIKSGMAVDYPLFGETLKPSIQLTSSPSDEYSYQTLALDNTNFIGNNISASGSYLVVGQPHLAGPTSSNLEEGLVKVYKLSETGKSVKEWTLLTTIECPTAGASKKFGTKVHINDDFLVITSRERSTSFSGAQQGESIQGVLYVYEVNTTSNTFTHSSDSKITFNQSTQRDSNNILLGSYNWHGRAQISKDILASSDINFRNSSNTPTGQVRIWRPYTAAGSFGQAAPRPYDFDNSTTAAQSPSQIISPPTGNNFPDPSNIQFGASIEIYKQMLVIGADMGAGTAAADGSLGGVVYIYKDSGGVNPEYVYDQILFSPVPGGGQRFGKKISISDDGTTIAVGAPGGTDTLFRQRDGAVHIYELSSSGQYEFSQTITAPDDSSAPLFGLDVKIKGNSLTVLSAATQGQKGAAHFYYKDQTGKYIYANDLFTDTQFATVAGTDFSHQQIAAASDKILVRVDYENFDSTNNTRNSILSAHITTNGAVESFDQVKRTITSPASGFNGYLKNLQVMTGSLVNATSDSGSPRLKGDVYRRITFEEMMNPDSLKGISIEDHEPHPSASIYYADKYSGKVMDFPFRFGELDANNNEIDLGVSSFSLKKSFDTTMKPYRLAINNFCAETVNFFLKDGKVSSLETRGVVAPKLFANEIYKMRVEVVNSGLRMYDRHSAFGPPVDEGEFTLLDSGSSKKFTNQHAHSPFVPPFLDTDSSPYVDISFTPTESREHTLEEIIDGAQYSYVNFSATPDNASENTNYINAMSLSASLKLDGFVIYESDNPDQGTTLNQRTRWVIQPRWETPILNFVDATVSSLRLDTNQVESRNSRSGLPWQKRGWKNFYTSHPSASVIPYLTSSTGMWHQAGTIPKSEGEGYTLRITPHPDVARPRNQLADRVGFTNENSISTQVGQLRNRKVVYESVIAIPFLEPDEEGGVITYFNLDQSSLDAAAQLNRSAREATVARLGALVTNSEEYIAAEQEAERLYNTPGQGPTEAAAYILRMQEKFVIPEEFRNKMMYVFQYSAEFTKQDLANIWQNVAPTSDFSGKELRYSTVDPTQGISGVSQDVQYVSNFLNELSPTEVPMNFKKDKIRWIVIKAKQRAEFDLNIVKRNSLRGVDLGLTVDDSRGTFNATPELENAKYSFNWPYDFFSIVELVKLEGKVDIFDGVAPIVDESGEDQ